MSLKKFIAPLALVGSLFFASPHPVEAQKFYLTGGIGAFGPTDTNYQQIYGTMLEGKLGVGLESEDGWAVETDLMAASGQGKPYTIGGASASSQLTDLEFAARVSKAFGKKEDVRPYIGVQVSYDSLTETLTTSYMGESESASGSAAGWGDGIFGGVEIPLSKSLSLYLEGIYNHTQVSAKLNSSSGSGQAGVNSNALDSGGLAGIVGFKLEF